MTTLCLIINSFGRKWAEIEPSVQSALANNFDEIFIIDQNNNSDFKNLNGTTLLHFPNKSISAARNFAAANAKSDWLIFLDDDAVLSLSYRKNFDSFIKSHQDSAIIGGRILTKEDPLRGYSKRQNIQTQKIGFLTSKSIMGGNVAVQKTAFDAVGGFDEQFGIGSTYPSSEDTDLVWKCYFSNMSIYFCRELEVTHPSPSNLSSAKEYSYGLGKGAMVNKWLKKGKFICVLEILEMLIIPILSFKMNRFHGRIKGLFLHV